MKKLKKIFAMASAFIALSTGTFNVYAENDVIHAGEACATVISSTLVSAEERENICVVVGANSDSVMLDMGCVLFHDEYQKYSGSSSLLKYGDVIDINNVKIYPLAPGRFSFDDTSSIKYIGTVSDYYADNIRELTVTEKKGISQFELTDSEGTPYTWITDASSMDMFGYSYDVDPRFINVGDVINCAVEYSEYYQGEVLEHRWEVVLPVESEKHSPIGDIIDETAVLNGDANGDGVKSIRDCAFIANALANAKADSLPDTADYNRDGKKDVRDAAAIANYLATR